MTAYHLNEQEKNNLGSAFHIFMAKYLMIPKGKKTKDMLYEECRKILHLKQKQNLSSGEYKEAVAIGSWGKRTAEAMTQKNKKQTGRKREQWSTKDHR
jgi:hypothetical protein